MEKDDFIANPWTAWKQAQEERQAEERRRLLSDFEKRDFSFQIRELSKIKNDLDENQKRFISRLSRYEDRQNLTLDEVRYLAKTYHALRQKSPIHAEYCPLCNGKVMTE